MWNTEGHVFENNACRCHLRNKRGLEKITQQESDLGIQSLLLVDGDTTVRDVRKIEQGCQYEINHMLLGSNINCTDDPARVYLGLDNDPEADVTACRVWLESRGYLPTCFIAFQHLRCWLGG